MSTFSIFYFAFLIYKVKDEKKTEVDKEQT